MGEAVYRSEQVGVRLVNPGSTFASRFGRWIKAARGPFLAYVCACATIALVLLTGMGAWHSPDLQDAEARRWIWGVGLILFAALGSGLFPALLVGIVKSLPGDSEERLLPRELHLFEDHVRVVPFTGNAFNTPWSAYVLRATAAPSGLRLLLGREPRLEFFVRRGALTAHEWALVQRWLAAQDLLGG